MKIDTFWGTVLFGAGISCMGWTLMPVQAQTIVPDMSLGLESSQLVPVDANTTRIEQGAIRGSNLFHSFETFSIGTDRIVHFANPVGITHIFSRVTGNTRSDIFGTLGVAGNANLFLLNPNGILLGPNATLDIPGSFVGSTASRLDFGNGLEFSATTPGAAPLLNIGITPGLQLGSIGVDNQPQGTITTQANLQVGQDLRFEANSLELQGQVQAGGNLTLHSLSQSNPQPPSDSAFVARAGGNVNLSSYIGNSLQIFAGQEVNADSITIIAAAGSTQANTLNETVVLSSGETLRIDGMGQPTVDIRAGVSSNALGSFLNTSGNGSFASMPTGTTSLSSADINIGTLKIQAPNGQVFLSNQYQPNALPNGGNINVEQIVGADFEILRDAQGNPQRDDQGNLQKVNRFSGNATDITIDARQDFVVRDQVDVSAMTGSPGEIKIRAGGETRLDESYLITVNNGPFAPGNIDIRTGSFSALEGSQLRISSAGLGDAGKVTINATGAVLFDSLVPRQNQEKPNQNQQVDRSGIDNRILDSDLPDEPLVRSGGVVINAQDITISNGAQFQIRVLDDATGESGNIQLTAEDSIAVIGVAPVSRGENSSGLITSIELAGRGKAGDIILEGDRVTIVEGASLQSNTRGEGDAGNIFVTARESIELARRGRRRGNGRPGRFSIIQSRVNGNGTGKAGDVRLEAPIITIADEANIRSNAEPDNMRDLNRENGIGNGGQITIIAPNQFNLRNGAELATSVSERGSFAGDISIHTGVFEMQNRARIRAGADGQLPNSDPQGRQGGGNVEIRATEAVKILGESSISTEQEEGSTGNAGRILIQAPEIEVRDASEISSLSDGNGSGGAIALIAEQGNLRIANDSKITAEIQERGTGRAGDIRAPRKIGIDDLIVRS